MFVKVCGMRNAEKVKQVAALSPQYMGFIFYKLSKRFVGEDYNTALLHDLPTNIKKIGVFVNEDLAKLVALVNTYKLDGVQLHGDESLAYSNELRGLLGSE